MAVNVDVEYNGEFSPRHHTVDPMLLPLGNPVESCEGFLSLQSMFPPKGFGTFL